MTQDEINVALNWSLRRMFALTDSVWINRARSIRSEFFQGQQNEDKVAAGALYMAGVPFAQVIEGKRFTPLPSTGLDKDERMDAYRDAIREATGKAQPSKDGKDIPPALLVGRVISIGRDEDWFANSLMVPQWGERRIRSYFDSSYQQGMNCAWVSISTGNRPQMNERTFDALENKARVHERLEYIRSLGIHPIPEVTQEFLLQNLSRDESAWADYFEAVAQEFYGRHSRMYMATREIGDFTWPSNRSAAYNRWFRAVRKGAGAKGVVLIHERTLEAPSTEWFPGVGRAWWGAQTPLNGDELRDEVTGVDDNHRRRTWRNAIEWLKYWSENRKDVLGDDFETIAFEHSLSNRYGNIQGDSLERITRRGRNFLNGCPEVISDLSGGYKRAA